MRQSRSSDDETARLSALASYEILDTEPDQRIDCLVKLTADLYEVPITAVSLIDRDRQWFKSSVGLAMQETPRDMALCAHAILSPDAVLVVEDATTDPRFRDNPLVRGEPFIRFYAGAPILSPEGHALGTLCIIDRTPRTLDSRARRHLQDLASSVGSTLDLHRSHQRLERAATHDHLTGLANRAMLEPALETAVQSGVAGAPFAVLCLDLDGFKPVNDKFGHAAGDQILAEVATRMLAAVRGTDLVARVGGDEFVILMAGPVPPEAAVALSVRLFASLARPFHFQGKSVAIGTSIGIAHCPADSTDAGGLLRAADLALYEAKRIGGGSAVSFVELETRQPIAEHSLAADLRHAINGGGFTHDWQPVWSLATGRTIGHEALIRWHRPAHGPVPPSQFIALAESMGLIAKLDEWSLSAACAAAAAWPVRHDIAVNMSAVSFSLGDVPRVVAKALDASSLDPDRLIIELTERTLIHHGDGFERQIIELHAMGVRVSLDDFGTGYSSLSYLREFAFDILKLDRSFVQDLTRDPRADAIVQAILGVARAVGMSVCAEGIETNAQLVCLRQLKCDSAQGFLLGRPTRTPQFAGDLALLTLPLRSKVGEDVA